MAPHPRLHGKNANAFLAVEEGGFHNHHGTGYHLKGFLGAAEGVFSALKGLTFAEHEIHGGKTSFEHRTFFLLAGRFPSGRDYLRLCLRHLCARPV